MNGENMSNPLEGFSRPHKNKFIFSPWVWFAFTAFFFCLSVLLLLAQSSPAVAAQPARSQIAHAEPIDALSLKQKEFRALAAKGDYQGMRNIAYSYAAPFKGEAGSKVSGCAWYLLVPVVHKDKFDAGDVGNVSVYCGKLSQLELTTAYEYAFKTLAAK